MNRTIVPANIKHHVKAFFTGKELGADADSISSMLGISKDKIYMPVQKHTDKVIILDSDLSPKIGDAVITKEKGMLIGVQVADCVPVLLYDRIRSVIGAVHAGWRGTSEGILRKTIGKMTERFFCAPENILIAIGPSIRWCCYGVDYDVFKKVKHATGEGEYHIQKDGKYCLDLPTANRYQALSLGVPETNIWISDECTFCFPDRFYSYRFAKGTTGRQGGFIGMIE